MLPYFQEFKMHLWKCALLCGVELVQLTVYGNQIILFPVFKLYKKACREQGKPQMSHLSLLKTAVLQGNIKRGLSEALTITMRHFLNSNQITTGSRWNCYIIQDWSLWWKFKEYKKSQLQKWEKEWVISK